MAGPKGLTADSTEEEVDANLNNKDFYPPACSTIRRMEWAIPSGAIATTPKQVVDILNFALTLQ